MYHEGARKPPVPPLLKGMGLNGQKRAEIFNYISKGKGLKKKALER